MVNKGSLLARTHNIFVIGFYVSIISFQTGHTKAVFLLCSVLFLGGFSGDGDDSERLLVLVLHMI